jgi:4-amino-4-deoxy-L-arabinose transferase-like glycosyltransferase
MMKRISALHLILALTLTLAVLGIWWGLPDYRGWAPDELVPSRVADAMRVYFSNGWYDRYPPFHYYLLGLLYTPFLLLHSLHVIDLHQLPAFTVLFYIGRLLSVAMGTGVIYFVYRAGRELFDRRASLFAALIAALVVPFEYYAKMVNLDVPYLFWFAVSLYFYVRLLKGQRLKDYLLFTAAAVVAVCTKDQAFGLYVLSPLPAVILNWKHRRQADPRLSLVRSLADRKYLYSVLTGVGLFAVLQNFAFNFRGFLGHVALIRGPASVPFRMFDTTVSGRARLLSLTVHQIQGSLGWPLFLICAVGLAAALLQRTKDPLLLSFLVFALSYYVFYISLIGYNFDRFNLPICLVLAFFGGSLISRFLVAPTGSRTAKIALLAVVFAISFLYSLSVDVLMIADSRYAVEGWIGKNIPPESTIGALGPAEYLPRLFGRRVTGLEPSPEIFRMASRPDYLIFPTLYGRSFPVGSAAHRFFSSLAEPGEGYRLVLRRQTRLPWLVIRYHGTGTNMSLVNPEIQVYRRTGPGAGS